MARNLSMKGRGLFIYTSPVELPISCNVLLTSPIFQNNRNVNSHCFCAIAGFYKTPEVGTILLKTNRK